MRPLEGEEGYVPNIAEDHFGLLALVEVAILEDARQRITRLDDKVASTCEKRRYLALGCSQSRLHSAQMPGMAADSVGAIQRVDSLMRD